MTIYADETRRYADDLEASKDFELTVTDDRGDLDFTPSVTATATSGTAPTTLTATWLDPVGTTRRLRVNLNGLPKGQTRWLRLVVPGGNDVNLGNVTLS